MLCTPASQPTTPSSLAEDVVMSVNYLRDCFVVFRSEEVNTWLSGWKPAVECVISTDIIAGRFEKTIYKMKYNYKAIALVSEQIANLMTCSEVLSRILRICIVILCFIIHYNATPNTLSYYTLYLAGILCSNTQRSCIEV